MQYVSFGPQEWKVSSIGFGGASLSGEGGGYGFGPMSELQAEKILRDSFELGINLFDTAPIYGYGLSEQRIGKYLKQERSQIRIISKAGIDWHSSKRVDLNNHPQVIQKMLEQSLKRLDTDYIDIYMLHWPDPRHSSDAALEVLLKAKEEKKILNIGFCNLNMAEWSNLRNKNLIDFLQEPENLFSPQNILNSLETDILNRKLGVTTWGSFDKGIITARAKAQSKFDSCDARSWAPWWKKQNKEQKYKCIEAIESYLKQNTHLSLAQLAIYWVQNKYSFPLVPLVGFKTTKDIEDSITKNQSSFNEFNNHKNEIKKILMEYSFVS